jgi:hypothetical protein
LNPERAGAVERVTDHITVPMAMPPPGSKDRNTYRTVPSLICRVFRSEWKSRA